MPKVSIEKYKQYLQALFRVSKKDRQANFAKLYEVITKEERPELISILTDEAIISNQVIWLKEFIIYAKNFHQSDTHHTLSWNLMYSEFKFFSMNPNNKNRLVDKFKQILITEQCRGCQHSFYRQIALSADLNLLDELKCLPEPEIYHLIRYLSPSHLDSLIVFLKAEKSSARHNRVIVSCLIALATRLIDSIVNSRESLKALFPDYNPLNQGFPFLGKKQIHFVPRELHREIMREIPKRCEPQTACYILVSLSQYLMSNWGTIAQDSIAYYLNRAVELFQANAQILMYSKTQLQFYGVTPTENLIASIIHLVEKHPEKKRIMTNLILFRERVLVGDSIDDLLLTTLQTRLKMIEGRDEASSTLRQDQRR